MPTYLEVGEIFLDPEIQVAQIVGWKNGDAKSSGVAVTRDCFAEFSLCSEIAASQVLNPLNTHSPSFFIFFSSFFFHFKSPMAQQRVLGTPWGDLHAVGV